MGTVSALLQQFTGYMPTSRFASRVVGPPASLLTPAQRQVVRGDALSFRHVAGRSAHTPYKNAKEWIKESVHEGILQSVGPTIFVYRQIQDGIATTGLIGNISLNSYASGRIEPHETTIPKTEKKMVRYMDSTRIYGNPIALAHRANPDVDAAIAAQTSRDPDNSFTTIDGIAHLLWIMPAQEARELCNTFQDTLYVTDGHHRLAAALAVARNEGRADASMPAGLFSADRMQLRSFARTITDQDLDRPAIVDRLGSMFEFEEVVEAEARARQRNEYGVKIGERYFRLRLGLDEIPDDPYDALAVNLLQERILGPVFGIANPRQDDRLDFVAHLTEDSLTGFPCDAWFLPFPVSVADVMAVADSGRVMPPKSTWFAPKLPSGIVIRGING